ncbi:hypothetical protein LX36DRAFT_154747 [Colletotrichum falcatum]|nr:hypothetical protein LX36DRAFT_154747 [Colletotrichum falcatum]
MYHVSQAGHFGTYDPATAGGASAALILSVFFLLPPGGSGSCKDRCLPCLQEPPRLPPCPRERLRLKRGDRATRPIHHVCLYVSRISSLQPREG